jgi:hypothetical protein
MKIYVVTYHGYWETRQIKRQVSVKARTKAAAHGLVLEAVQATDIGTACVITSVREVK